MQIHGWQVYLIIVGCLLLDVFHTLSTPKNGKINFTDLFAVLTQINLAPLKRAHRKGARLAHLKCEYSVLVLRQNK
jgi:hypothetical protein